MKKIKKIQLILLLILTVICTSLNIVYAVSVTDTEVMTTLEENNENPIIDDKGPEINIEYQYNEDNTLCTIVVTSNEEMIQKTTPGWVLSEDKKVYTYDTKVNTGMITNFTDQYGNYTQVQLIVDKIDERPANIEVSYEYKPETNTVIATMTSDRELQNTKTTWKLSEDKKHYTYEFDANTTYMSSVVDIYGNVVPVPISVTLVDDKGPEINIEYQYSEDNLLCTIVVTSNEEMIQKTTPGWVLSENKKVYTYDVKVNSGMITNFTDKYGNFTQVQLIVDKIDERPANIEVSYEYKPETNTVIATMTSDRELQNTKTTWKLSEDKKHYTYEFDGNTTYMSSVVDIYGNVVPVQISVTQIDDKGPEIKIEYIFNEDKTQCTVQVTSNEEMMPKTTPGWVLSEDKKVYTYVGTKNQKMITNFTDKYGNFTQATIDIFFNLNGIDVSKHQGKIDWEAVKASGQVDFAIIRCGYGQDRTSQDDEWFEYNVSECERLGIPYGVYLYSYAVDLNCANSEADHVLRLIKGKNPTYGIWYDLEEEVDEFGTPIPNEMLVDIAITFCEKMKANGYDYVGIYANLNWFQNKLNDARLDQYPKWVAQWNDECTYEKDYDMWQYTSSGQVPGIDGRVDMNKYYKQR